MKRASLSALVLSLALTLASACGGDDDGDSGTGVDAGVDACVAEALPTQYRPIASVSDGTIETSQDGVVTNAVVDATAGGLDGAADNPYIYIDLEGGGVKVELDDVDALASDEWDIAFKRSSIRVNGGDSGPGNVAVAVVEAESLDDVTEVPGSSTFADDDFASDDCEPQLLPGGEPATAFGEWYGYDEKTHALTPKAEVHVVRTRSGDHFKILIETYYGGDSPMVGAIYRVSWARL
jgi:hypothetical protein